LQTLPISVSFPFPDMTRTAAAVIAMMGVLALSMPGGACFLWAGLGVEHHHHDAAEERAVADHCFHEHDCGDHGEQPAEPCAPSEDPALVASFSAFKLLTQVPLAVADFSPDWVKAPEFSLSSGARHFAGVLFSKRPNAPPPPAESRLCRFLI
jgi:hypothetical protein